MNGSHTYVSCLCRRPRICGKALGKRLCTWVTAWYNGITLCCRVWHGLLQGLTLFVAGFHDYMLAYIIDVCMVVTYGWVLKDYLGCMVLTLECGLRHFSVEEQCWLWQWSYGTLVMRYIMMMLVRYVIDLLRHTSSTYWLLSICCSEWRLRLICWGTWLVHIWVSLIYLMMYYWKHIVGYLGAFIWHMDGLHIGTCSWWVDEVVMLYTIDES